MRLFLRKRRPYDQFPLYNADIQSSTGIPYLIARSVHHHSFLAEQTSGEVTLRHPASKEGATRRIR